VQGTGVASEVGSFILPTPSSAHDVVNCGRCGSIDFVVVISIKHATAALLCAGCGNSIPVPAHFLLEEDTDGS